MATTPHLSVAEASKMLNISRHKLYRLIRDEKLPVVRKHPILIRRSDVVKAQKRAA